MDDGGLVVISVAGQSVRCPPGALRARQPDRALPQDQEAELQADHPRCQGRLLQAAPVPERLEGALSRHDRMGVAVAGRQGHLGRCRDHDARHRFRQAQGRRRQRHPAAEGRPHRRRRRRRRPHRLVPDRSGDLRVEAACPTSTSSATPPSPARMPKSAFAANAQAKVCAAAVAQPARRRDAGRAEADQHLLQPGRARLRDLASPASIAGRRRVRRGRGAGGISPVDAPRAIRARGSRRCAEAWFKTITGEVFG